MPATTIWIRKSAVARHSNERKAVAADSTNYRDYLWLGQIAAIGRASRTRRKKR